MLFFSFESCTVFIKCCDIHTLPTNTVLEQEIPLTQGLSCRMLLANQILVNVLYLWFLYWFTVMFVLFRLHTFSNACCLDHRYLYCIKCTDRKLLLFSLVSVMTVNFLLFFFIFLHAFFKSSTNLTTIYCNLLRPTPFYPRHLLLPVIPSNQNAL